MKSLFKKDSKGKIRVWNVYTEGDLLVQESGLFEGKLIKHEKKCASKNIGKTNATSPSEQAELEMYSCYLSKLTEGYFETEEQAKNEVVILPMLAVDYNKHSKKINWDNDVVFEQPKLDGMRCLAIIKSGEVTLKSRDGKIIGNMSHIEKDLEQLPDCILDGELYCHGKSFQENMKLIKKYRKGETERISYHVYDIVSDVDFENRNEMINQIFDQYKFNYLVNVYTRFILSEQELKDYHILNINDGYEGSIVRVSGKSYEMDKRSDSLLKYKDFSDMDLEIFQITANDANPKHGTPHFNLNGKAFKAGVKMSHEDREDLLINKDKYISKIANVRYFELTDDGIPRFPVMIGIHGDR